MPSFSFRGVSTVQSSTPSPIPARSTWSAAATAAACVELWFTFLLPLDFDPNVFSSGRLVSAVAGLELSLSGSFCHDTLSKSLSMGRLWEVGGTSPALRRTGGIGQRLGFRHKDKTRNQINLIVVQKRFTCRI